MHLKKVVKKDKEEIKAMSAGIWEGNDYIPKVFDGWVNEEGFYKGVLDGKIIAVCKYTRQPGSVLWLEGLRVHPEYQDKGYGSKVADMFHELIVGKEHSALRFMTDATNSKSIHLAEKRGFDVILELYHLDFEGDGEKPYDIDVEHDVEAVKDYVFSSEGYEDYKGMYIRNWTAYEFTEGLLEEEVKSSNCYTVKEGDEIKGIMFLNFYKRYGRVSIPFIAGGEDVVEGLLLYAQWWCDEYGKGYLFLKTPYEDIKDIAQYLGMEQAPYRKVLILELKGSEEDG